MKRLYVLIIPALIFFFSSVFPASAHFGMVIPSDSMVMPEEVRTVDLILSFSHPFEAVGMVLEKPEHFTVTHEGRTSELTDQLEKTSTMGQTAWRMVYPFKRPGVYTFAMTPKPYWEPAEDLFIIHYTKTVVTTFGDDSGWDAELGLPTEIVALSKPFAQYAGNIFQGIVKLNGNPVPYAEVEVEYLNRDGRIKAPNDYFITQTVKADKNGVFSYAAPAAGWWGFSALNTADYQLKKDGENKDVELGAVLWVNFHHWPK